MSLYLRAREIPSPCSGSQSKCRIRFTLPTLGFRNIIKIVICSQLFRHASCRLPATWFGLKFWLVRLNFRYRGSNAKSKKRRFKQAKIYVRNTCWFISTTTWNFVKRRLIGVVTARRPNFLSLRRGPTCVIIQFQGSLASLEKLSEIG